MVSYSQIIPVGHHWSRPLETPNYTPLPVYMMFFVVSRQNYPVEQRVHSIGKIIVIIVMESLL